MRVLVFLTPILLLLSFIPNATANSPAAKPNREYLSLIDTADNYVRRENWTLAEEYLIKALKLQPAHPTNSLLFTNLGICKLNQSKPHEALQYFEIAEVKSPESPKILLNKARTLVLLDRNREAVSLLNTIIKKDSINSDALLLRGNLLLLANDYNGAVRDYERLSTIISPDPQLLSSLAHGYANINESAKAAKTYEEALLKEHPSTVDQAAALFYISIDNIERAKEIINRSIRKNPNEGNLYMIRAIIHEILYQNSDAEIDKKIAMAKGTDLKDFDQYLPTELKRKRK